MKLRKSDIWDIVATIGIVVVVCVCYGLMATYANAGTVCRVQKQVAYAQPLLAPVYYQIGQSVQREAADTLQFRHSEEYIELQQLRGFKAGVDAVTASDVTTSGPPQPASQSGHPAATGGEAEIPPANPSPELDAFYERYTTLAQNCSRCHTGDSPKGDVFLDGTVPLDGPDAATKRDAIARAIVNGHMPPNRVLEDQEQFNALVELFTEPTPPEGE